MLLRSKIILLVSIAVIIGGWFVYKLSKKSTGNEMKQTKAARAIRVIPCQEEWFDKLDEGFAKNIIVFENFSQSEIESCEMKRLFPYNTKEESPFFNVKQFVVSINDIANMPQMLKDEPILKNNPVMILSSKGFLPAEEITIRLKKEESEEYEWLQCFPHPLITVDLDGKIVCMAKLASLVPTSYHIEIAYDPSNKLIKAGDDAEENEVVQEGPSYFHYVVENQEAEGGINTLKFTFENGTAHHIQLPWGANLQHYLVETAQN
ncbi:MAG: hypothetical protein FJZ56_02150 [Chlamydiae bacterium]|nr:hypothetical protein [Chlamydiota bacterium]